jgi:chromosome segregation ATPase
MTSATHALKATEDLFKQLKEVFESESCQNLTAIVTENSELRKRIGHLEITNNMILESMGKLKQELKLSLEKTTNLSVEVETLIAEKDKIAGTLNDHKSSAEEKSKQLQDKITEVSSLKFELKKEEANSQKLKKQQEEKDKSLKRAESDKSKAETELAALRSTLSMTSKRLEDVEQLRFKLEKPQKGQLYVALPRSS